MSRPLARPASISRCSSNASTVSIQSAGSTMSRPSLIVPGEASGFDQVPWQVQDSRTRPIPTFYPPMNPRCTALITDASPSIVAARIADALARRSISVEYDDESVSPFFVIVGTVSSSPLMISPHLLHSSFHQQTATCMTVDRMHFTVHLWKGNKVQHSFALDSIDIIPDFSDAVIVEVLRTRGNVISFHRACQGILTAAMGYSSGEDTRKPYQTSVLEFPRLISREEGMPSAKRVALSNPRSQSIVAMEHAVSLLKKDRIGAQQLGMESLVNLTDSLGCGPELATHVSLAVLGSPVASGVGTADNRTMNDVHNIVFRLIQERTLPGEVEYVSDGVNTSFQSSTMPGLTSVTDADHESHMDSIDSMSLGDEYHGGRMRSMALRVLVNALTILDSTQPRLLGTIMAGSAMESQRVLQALAEDLLGATRPPAVVVGTRLASVHEAALVMKGLRLIAQYSDKAPSLLVNPKNMEHPILETLLRAKHVPHAVLQREAHETYAVLSQDARTC